MLYGSMALLGIQTVSGSMQFIPRKGFQLERPGMSIQSFNGEGTGQPDELGIIRRKLIRAYNCGMLDEHDAVIQLAINAWQRIKEAEDKAREARISKELVKKEPIKEPIQIDKLKEYFNKIPATRDNKSEMYKDYQKKKRDYTELAVARKNIDIILERDYEEDHDTIEKDDPEHWR